MVSKEQTFHISHACAYLKKCFNVKSYNVQNIFMWRRRRRISTGIFQFVIFKPLNHCFEETIGFDVKASFESRPLSRRLIRWYNETILIKGYSVPWDFSWIENYKLIRRTFNSDSFFPTAWKKIVASLKPIDLFTCETASSSAQFKAKR